MADLLRETERELRRLESGADAEALHDFRVALRRLRSVLRALRPWVRGTIGRKQERRLRAIARATGPARDAEVQLEWLARERASALPRELPGIDWLARRLEDQHQEGTQRGTRAAAGRFRRVARWMVKALSRAGPPDTAAGAEPPSLGVTLAELVRSQSAELCDALDRVGGPFQAKPAHAARIAAKRVRYLLAPLRGCLPAEAEAAAALLKELQELLGDLHDSHVAGELVADVLLELAAERVRQAHAAIMAGERGARPLRLAGRGSTTRGLLALDGHAADRAVAIHARLAEEWIPSRRSALVGALEEVARALAPAGPRASPRRFLLAHLPGELASEAALQIETGWLAGSHSPVWLRRVKGSTGAQFQRGEGAEPSSGEEISEANFDALWPGTADHRLAARRHLLVDKGQTWIIDAVEGLRLVLAEVVAPGGDLRIPRCLRSAMVREVTEEKTYRSSALCARQRRGLAVAAAGDVTGRSGPQGAAPGDLPPSLDAIGRSAGDADDPLEPPARCT